MPGPWEKYQQQAQTAQQDGPWNKYRDSVSGPWEKYQQQAQSAEDAKAQDQQNMGTAALEHFGNAAALGYLPHLQAAAEPVTDKIFNAITGQNVPENDSNYVQRRDQNINRLKQEEQNYPKASLAGTVAGSVAGGAALSSAVPLKASTALGKVAQAGAVAGATGAIANPGDTEGQVSPIQLEQRAKNAAMAMPMGIAGQAVAEGVGALGENLANSAQHMAYEKAIQATGAFKKDFKQIFDKDKLESLGSVLLDKENNLLPTISSVKSISENLDAAHEAAGKQIGNIIKPVSDEMGPIIDARALAQQISADPSIAQLAKVPGQEHISERILGYLNTLSKNGVMTLEQAQDLRQGIDRSIDFAKRTPDMAGAQPYLAKIRNEIADSMNDVVNVYSKATGGSMPLDQLKMANRAYSQLTQLKDIADNRMASIAANRAVGLTDTIAGGAGASVGATLGGSLGPGGAKLGATIGGAVGAGANKLGRTYGSAFLANAANTASNVFQLGPAVERAVNNNPVILPAFQASVQQANTPKDAIQRRMERRLGSGSR